KRDQEITVYAYHEQDATTKNKQAREKISKTNALYKKINPDSAAEPTTMILTERKLAGKLLVLKNDASVQKELKIVLMKVKTDVNAGGVSEMGIYDLSEINKLSHTLHQALVH